MKAGLSQQVSAVVARDVFVSGAPMEVQGEIGPGGQQREDLRPDAEGHR